MATVNRGLLRNLVTGYARGDVEATLFNSIQFKMDLLYHMAAEKLNCMWFYTLKWYNKIYGQFKGEVQ